MYSRFQLAGKYIRHYLTASNGRGHGIHSPFVFDFVRHVLNDTSRYPAYAAVESLRNGLLHEHTLLEVRDLGAGASGQIKTRRRIADIARHAAKPAKYGQLLFRIVRYYRPQTVVELGTSLGITTAYLALANSVAQVITLEGAPGIAAVAKRNFHRLALGNVECIEGNFNATLPMVLQRIGTAGLVFIDGNHRKAPTMSYFNLLLEKADKNSILVFDDIHWSGEMEEAWEAIRVHPSVKLTIDLFFIGMVFFKDEFKVRQHFVIRY